MQVTAPPKILVNFYDVSLVDHIFYSHHDNLRF